MLSGGVLDEVGGVLDEVDVEVGDQSNQRLLWLEPNISYLTVTVAMSLALCHLNIARIRLG